MPKFNRKLEIRPEIRADSTNLAGGRAFGQSPELEFASMLLTSFVSDQFYRKEAETLERVPQLLDGGVSHEFAAKAAIYARDQFNMRSISHVVAAELAARVKDSQWMRPFVRDVIVRVDDMLEILAYYEGKYGRQPVPNALKRGMRDAFAKFDGYQLAKYRGERSAVKLVDVVNLVHPVPTELNRDALNQLVADKLRSTDTWESRLSQAGQADESEVNRSEMKAEAWAGLVRSRKIGYMALVRNLRNILEDAPQVVSDAADMLVQQELVRRSRLLPFRFVTSRDELLKWREDRRVARKAGNSFWSRLVRAYKGIPEPMAPEPEPVVDPVDLLLEALDRAADLALANVPKLEGRTLVVVDGSGSMTWNGGPIKIASLFAAVILRTNPEADLMMFDTDARYLSINPEDSVLAVQRQIEDRAKGGGTNFNAVFDRATKVYDRVVILSDMQGWMAGGYNRVGAPTEAFAGYRKRTGADPKVFSFDLQGYGTLMFPERNVYALAGFSEKVFDVMALLERDREALVHEIEAVTLR